MKRKVLCIILSILCMLIGCGFAEGTTMQVMNCQEWVSLRAEPDTASKRLCEVPLGAYVSNCKKYTDEFTYAEYEGQSGYILTKYLAAVSDFNAAPAWTEPIWDQCSLPYTELLDCGNQVLRQAVSSTLVIAMLDTSGDQELLRVEGFREGNAKWGYITGNTAGAQVQTVDAFIGGTADAPCVLIYNSNLGLNCIDPDSGEIRWTCAIGQLGTGGGLTHAVGSDGTLYLAGYFSANPVAVDAAGKVLWIGSPQDSNVYWPYGITLEGGNVIVDYESGTEEGHFRLTFSSEGALLNTELIPEAEYEPEEQE